MTSITIALVLLVLMGITIAQRKRPAFQRLRCVMPLFWVVLVLSIILRYCLTPAYRRGQFLADNKGIWLSLAAGPVGVLVLASLAYLAIKHQTKPLVPAQLNAEIAAVRSRIPTALGAAQTVEVGRG